VLDLSWTYPVQRFTHVQDVASGETTARSKRRVFGEREAYYEIAGDDRRPLLVLRECRWCNGTDDALLSRDGGNERTLIMARWFRCVKLPMEVTEGNHPFHNVFAGENPPHLLVTRWDGSEPRALRGDQSPSELWRHMEATLASEYGQSVKRTVREIERIIGKYDMLDEKIAKLTVDLDDELEASGPKSRKFKKLSKQLKQAKGELTSLKLQEAKLSALELVNPDEQPEPIASEEPQSTAGH